MAYKNKKWVIMDFIMVGFLILCSFGIEINAEEFYSQKILLSNSYYLEIEELSEYVKIELYKEKKVVDQIYLDRFGIKDELIEKVNLNSGEDEYFITAFFKDAVYRAQTNIIVWKNEKNEWNLFECPFVQGFVEDRNDDGIFEIVEYYIEEQIYTFWGGYLVRIGAEKIYDGNLLIEQSKYDMVKSLFNLNDDDQVYFKALCKLTPNDKKLPVVLYKNEDKPCRTYLGIKIDDISYTLDIDINNVGNELMPFNVKLDQVTSYNYPQLLFELLDREGNKYLYVVSWVNNDFKVIFSHILFDQRTQKCYDYNFYLEGGKNILEIIDEDKLTIYRWEKDTYVMMDEILW